MQDTFLLTLVKGSGKSTLMKFLEGHRETSRILHEWAGGARLVKASFYFWNAGTQMQKSIEGLLQSLLHTILSHRPELIAVLCPDRITSTDRQTHDTWSLAELKSIFARLILHQDQSTKFYFHIDGLDEYEGDPSEVIEVVESLAQQSTYKVCVSSRPWNQFEDSFGRSANKCLQLHLFTKEDIVCFARECLQGHRTKFVELNIQDQYAELVNEISKRAQGVFLWVRLVVHSLREGQFNSDPVSILRKRLDEIPTDLEKFFQQILESVHQVYGERMARTFLTALASPKPLKIIHYSFLDEDDPYLGWTTDFEPIDQDQINTRISSTRWRLNGRYKGLLEPDSNENSCHVTVDFLHRTLRDFLLNSRVEKYLIARAPKDFDPTRAAMGTTLAEAKFLSNNLEPRDFLHALEFATRIDALRGHNRLSEFQIMDHIEVMFRTVHIEAQESMHSPGSILIAAVHNHDFEYVKHRLQDCTSLSTLNWIFLHLACYSPDPFENTFPELLNQGYLDTSSLCECDVEINPEETILDVDLISELMLRGANPNAEVHNTVIWTSFLKKLGLEITGPLFEAYWDMLRLMVDKGAVLNGHDDQWIGILDQIPSMEPKPLEHLLDNFSFLLERGLKADTKMWLVLLFRMTSRQEITETQGRFLHYSLTTTYAPAGYFNLWNRSRQLYHTLCRTFLENGAIVSGIIDIPPECAITSISWFDRFRMRLEWKEAESLEYVDDVYDLFEIFFENGLDSNHEVWGSTIWELFLDVLFTADCNGGIARLILLFLKNRADPTSEKLHQILGLAPGYRCLFREPEASDLRSAVDRELADLRDRDRLLEQQTSMTPYSRGSAIRDRTSSTPENAQRKPGAKRTYSGSRKHVKSSHKRARKQ